MKIKKIIPAKLEDVNVPIREFGVRKSFVKEVK